MIHAHCLPATHVPTPYLIVVSIVFGAGGCPWMRCDHLRPPRRAWSQIRRGMKNGSLAMVIYSIVVLPEPPVADSRFWAGCKRWEKEVVIELIKKGRMDENSPYYSMHHLWPCWCRLGCCSVGDVIYNTVIRQCLCMVNPRRCPKERGWG